MPRYFHFNVLYVYLVPRHITQLKRGPYRVDLYNAGAKVPLKSLCTDGINY